MTRRRQVGRPLQNDIPFQDHVAQPKRESLSEKSSDDFKCACWFDAQGYEGSPSNQLQNTIQFAFEFVLASWCSGAQPSLLPPCLPSSFFPMREPLCIPVKWPSTLCAAHRRDGETARLASKDAVMRLGNPFLLIRVGIYRTTRTLGELYNRALWKSHLKTCTIR